MTYNKVLSQTSALLHQHGRVSYRALTAQFQLDDDLIALMKEESIAVHQRASDQEGTMLVWRGETPTTPVPARQAPTHEVSAAAASR